MAFSSVNFTFTVTWSYGPVSRACSRPPGPEIENNFAYGALLSGFRQHFWLEDGAGRVSDNSIFS
jgi:hypothetical protein